MNVVCGALSCLLFATTLSTAEESVPTESWANRWNDARREYGTTGAEFRAAKTDGARIEAAERFAEFPKRFLDLSASSPDDPSASKSLRLALQAVISADSLALTSWELNREVFPSRLEDSPSEAIIDRLSGEFLGRDDLGVYCERMRYSVRVEFAAFLRKARRESPHRSVQAIATVSLAQFLEQRLEIARLIHEGPSRLKRYSTLFGARFGDELRRTDRPSLGREIEVLLEEAKEFVDVEMPNGGSVAKLAESELYEIRHLAVGKTAPETVGIDQDGETIRLSDYRGKVVLLYFWFEL